MKQAALSEWVEQDSDRAAFATKGLQFLCTLAPIQIPEQRNATNTAAA